MTLTMGMAVLPSGKASAQAAADCAAIAQDIAAALEKDASRILMIVEDALVINESCAGEIIKAAIVASHADAELANQIVQTGINVAPKMAAIITDAGASVAPGAIVAAAEQPAPVVELPEDTTFGGKEVVRTVAATNDEDEDADESFSPVSSSLRGIYLIQQPPSGAPPFDSCRKCDNVPTSPCNCTP